MDIPYYHYFEICFLIFSQILFLFSNVFSLIRYIQNQNLDFVSKCNRHDKLAQLFNYSCHLRFFGGTKGNTYYPIFRFFVFLFTFLVLKLMFLYFVSKIEILLAKINMTCYVIVIVLTLPSLLLHFQWQPKVTHSFFRLNRLLVCDPKSKKLEVEVWFVAEFGFALFY